MTHEFEIRKEITLDATPEQVWDAIATGPGVDSWFMGKNDIEPRLGGRGKMVTDYFTGEYTVTGWEPGQRFAYKGDENPDGTFMAFEYLIEARDSGSTVLRFVHSGFLGDDWEAEYSALEEGDGMYLEKLAVYVKYFAGTTSTYNMFVVGPQVPEAERVWTTYKEALGVTGLAEPGTATRLAVPGLPELQGTIEFAGYPGYLLVRTDHGLYAFMHGFQDATVVEYHNYLGSADEKLAETWQAWITEAFA